MANSISVSITADVADLVSKRAVLSSELKAATADLNSFAKTARTSGMTDELRAEMQKAAEATVKARAQIAALDVEMKKLAADSKGSSPFAGLKADVEQISALRESVAGLGQAIAAAFAVRELAEFASKLGETAEKSLKTAETFGLTVGEVQKMNAQATLFGVSGDALSTAMMRVDRSFAAAKQGSAQAANAFKAAGIDVNGAYTQTQLLSAALAGLANMEAGPAKIAAAMAMFGRNIQEIGPLLGLTKEQIAEANDEIEKYGAVNQEAASKGIALAEAQKENKVAMMGLGNVLTDTLAPAFKDVTSGLNDMTGAFVQSYKEGGAAKDQMDALGTAVKALADLFAFLGLIVDFVFKTIDGAIWGVNAVLDPLIDLVVGGCKTMGDAFRTFGDVTRDALTLNWGAIEGDITSGAQRVAADVVDTAKRMGADAAAAWKQGQDEWLSADSDASAYLAWEKKLWSQAQGAPLPKEGTGTTGADAGKKGAGSGAGGGLSLGGSDKALAGFDKFLADGRRAAQAFFNDLFAGYKRTSDAAVKADETAAKARQDSLEEQVAAVDRAEKEGVISARQAFVQKKALYEQERQAAIEAADQIYADRTLADRKIISSGEATAAQINAALKDETDAFAQMEAAKVAANAAADKKILSAEQQAAQQVKAQWDKTITPLVQDFGQGLLQMAEGAKNFGQVMAGIGQKMLGSFVNTVAGMVSKWLMEHTVMASIHALFNTQKVASDATASATAAATQKALAITQVSTMAGLAGAGGVASMAAAPFPLDLGAPAFGAAMSEAALAYGALASLDVGTNYVPNDMIAQIHAGERVIPAGDNRDLMALAARGGGFGSGGGGGHVFNFGDFNVHGGPSGMSPAEFRKALKDHATHVANAVHAAARGGWRSNEASPFRAG
jgi:hypothetical protein